MYYGTGTGGGFFAGTPRLSMILYFVLLILAVVSIFLSFRVRSTFARYSQVRSRSGMTGADTAKKMLQAAGIYDVQVVPIQGTLTDNYNPKQKTVNLSQGVYNSTSVAAIGVAAHECGHAMQDAENYAPLKIRHAILPVAQIGSYAGIPLVILGLILGRFDALIDIGIILFSAAVLFQLVTLPVEINATNRAIRLTQEYNILLPDEKEGCVKVLRTAGLTYVASAAISLVQLLRLLALRRSN